MANPGRDPFAGVLPFFATAEAKSFRAAARRLGVTPSSVSKSIAKLEQELGVRLLRRTSRSVATTSEGEAFLSRCRVAIEEMQAGREAVSRSATSPRGVLAVSMPQALGRLVVVPALPALLERHPHLSLELTLTDRFVRFTEEKIDVALRIGRLREESLIARQLRPVRWVTVASPAYLARRGTPRKPEDLLSHEALAFVLPDGTRQAWRFTVGGRAVTLDPRAALAGDDGMALVSAAVAGLGVVQAHDYMARAEIARGELVQVLADCAAPGPEISIVYAGRHDRSARVRAFVDFAASLLGPGGRGAT